MKAYVIAGMVWFSWAAPAAVVAQDAAKKYTLELACGQDRLLLGQEVECALKVDGYSLPSPGTGKLNDRVSLAFRTGPAAQGTATGFFYPFTFRPTKAGATVLGPFELGLEGRKLKSNRLQLWVIEPPPAGAALAISVSKSSVAVGEPFDLVLIERISDASDEAEEPNSSDAGRPAVTMSRTPPARVALVGSRALQIQGGARTTRVGDGGVEHVTFYQAVAREAGSLVIGRDFLAGLEPEEEAPEVVVEVR